MSCPGSRHVAIAVPVLLPNARPARKSSGAVQVLRATGGCCKRESRRCAPGTGCAQSTTCCAHCVYFLHLSGKFYPANRNSRAARLCKCRVHTGLAGETSNPLPGICRPCTDTSHRQMRPRHGLRATSFRHGAMRQTGAVADEHTSQQPRSQRIEKQASFARPPLLHCPYDRDTQDSNRDSTSRPGNSQRTGSRR